MAMRYCDTARQLTPVNSSLMVQSFVAPVEQVTCLNQCALYGLLGQLNHEAARQIPAPVVAWQ